ncbi:MAG: hypothetical protein ACKVT2_07615 [Saprospiraceae bacterium]
MENLNEKTEQYLLGELEGPELAAFENALQTDTALAKSVEQHRAMIQRLDALRLRKKVAAVLGSERTKVWLNRMFWVLAVLLGLMIAAYWVFKPDGPSKTSPVENQAPSLPTAPPIASPKETPGSPLPGNTPDNKPASDKQRLIALARKYQEHPSQTFVRDATQKESDTAPKTLAQQAAEAYYKQNFRLVVDLLKDDKQLEEDDSARFVRANARFNIGQFSGAAKDFDALNDSFQFKHEARWNFLLCQIALGNIRKAKALLAEMVVEEDFPFRAKAMDLKEKLVGI